MALSADSYAQQEAPEELQLTIAPLPPTERGFGIHIHGTDKGKPRIVYTNGTNVYVRSLENAGECVIFSGHKANVRAARFSPNGEWVASGDEQGIVIVWGSRNRIVKSAINTCRSVLDLAWSPDGKRLVACGDGDPTRARAFAWDSGTSVGEIGGHSGKVLSCDWKPDGRPFRVATCAEDKQLNFHKGAPFLLEHTFRQHTNYPNCVRYAPNGARFATVGSDRKIFLFEGKDGQMTSEVTSADGHKGSIYSVSWAPDSKRMATASADKTVKVWDADEGALVKTVTLGTELDDFQVAALWLQAGLVSVSLSGKVNFLGDAEDAPTKVWTGHQTQIRDLAVHKGSGSAFTCGDAGRVIQWNLATGEGSDVRDNDHGSNPIVGVAIAADESRLATAGFDNTLRFAPIGADGAAYTGSLALPSQPVQVTAGNADPALVAVITTQGHVIVVRGESVAATAQVEDPTSVAFSHDDAVLAVGTTTGDLHFFDVAAGDLTPKAVSKGVHRNTVSALAFSPDGKRFLSADHDRKIALWNPEDLSAPMATGWKYHNATITSASWDADSKNVVTASRDGSLRLWSAVADDKPMPKNVAIDPAHVGGTLGARYLDATTIVSIGGDKTVKVWKIGA